MRITLSMLTAGCITLWAGVAAATPSTTVWAPSTASVQGYLVPHLTYDTYFGKGVAAGQAGSPIYPVTTGLTMGVLPFEKINMEIGFDLFVPSTYPLLLNAKLGAPEGAFFSGSPGIGVGIFGVGTKKSTSTTAGTDFNVIYGQIQKSFPFGGYISVGGYYGAGSKILWTDDGTPTGKENRAGFIGGLYSPDIVVDKGWLKKITVGADIQTGKNVYGAAGISPYFFFTDTISVLTGPIFFFDKNLQPGASSWMWTIQLDVDMPLMPVPAAAPAAADAASPAAAPIST